MTPEEIARIADDEVDFVAFQCICSAFPSGNVPDAATVAALPAGQQMALLTSLLEMEVMNGGFNQYFYNHGEAFAALTLAGYSMIQAHKCAGIFSAALEVYHSERAQIQAVKAAGTLEAFSASYETTNLGKYDTDFCRAVRDEAVESLRAAYIRLHLHDEFAFLLTPRPAVILADWRARTARFDTD